MKADGFNLWFCQHESRMLSNIGGDFQAGNTGTLYSCELPENRFSSSHPIPPPPITPTPTPPDSNWFRKGQVQNNTSLDLCILQGVKVRCEVRFTTKWRREWPSVVFAAWEAGVGTRGDHAAITLNQSNTTPLVKKKKWRMRCGGEEGGENRKKWERKGGGPGAATLGADYWWSSERFQPPWPARLHRGYHWMTATASACPVAMTTEK